MLPRLGCRFGHQITALALVSHELTIPYSVTELVAQSLRAADYRVKCDACEDLVSPAAACSCRCCGEVCCRDNCTAVCYGCGQSLCAECVEDSACPDCVALCAAGSGSCVRCSRRVPAENYNFQCDECRQSVCPACTEARSCTACGVTAVLCGELDCLLSHRERRDCLHAGSGRKRRRDG
jgi:hypothetical protein